MRGRYAPRGLRVGGNVSIRAPACGGDTRSRGCRPRLGFQSAPPRAGAIRSSNGFICNWGFNPRPRVRGRYRTESGARRAQFQSAPPRAGAMRGRPPARRGHRFNPRPRVRGRSVEQYRRCRDVVSIRAPACGGDAETSPSSVIFSFQSAPPRAGAMGSRMHRPQRLGFNPRPRVRGRYRRTPQGLRLEVSIRAPACGGDLRPGKAVAAAEFQSAPPRAGAITGTATTPTPRCFNPRPRVRGRSGGSQQDCRASVSIRAPACGGDDARQVSEGRHRFQSAPPRAGAIAMQSNSDGSSLKEGWIANHPSLNIPLDAQGRPSMSKRQK